MNPKKLSRTALYFCQTAFNTMVSKFDRRLRFLLNRSSQANTTSRPDIVKYLGKRMKSWKHILVIYSVLLLTYRLQLITYIMLSTCWETSNTATIYFTLYRVYI